ncbi:hypothetical protein [Streptomyces sp. NPDC057939]|uniref:hypothetical protein n=1 Tax=Streptomyces sp. NPDC057939 TaxID=3346284 RepID=UPI0036EC1443
MTLSTGPSAGAVLADMVVAPGWVVTGRGSRDIGSAGKLRTFRRGVVDVGTRAGVATFAGVFPRSEPAERVSPDRPHHPYFL